MAESKKASADAENFEHIARGVAAIVVVVVVAVAAAAASSAACDCSRPWHSRTEVGHQRKTYYCGRQQLLLCC